MAAFLTLVGLTVAVTFALSSVIFRPRFQDWEEEK